MRFSRLDKKDSGLHFFETYRATIPSHEPDIDEPMDTYISVVESALGDIVGWVASSARKQNGGGGSLVKVCA